MYTNTRNIFVVVHNFVLATFATQKVLHTVPTSLFALILRACSLLCRPAKMFLSVLLQPFYMTHLRLDNFYLQ